jgi:hypothetical protein
MVEGEWSCININQHDNVSIKLHTLIQELSGGYRPMLWQKSVAL